LPCWIGTSTDLALVEIGSAREALRVEAVAALGHALSTSASMPTAETI
jgi:hypothetical protein